MERVTNLIFLGSKITADGDCSHEIKRHLLLGEKVMTNIKKQRHYFANKGPSSQRLQGDPTVHPKGDQFWVFIGRTDVEAETPILWLPDAKN